MVYQIHSNVTGDHQPKIPNDLNYLVLDWLDLHQPFCKLNYGNLKKFRKKRKTYILEKLLYHCSIKTIFRLP